MSWELIRAATASRLHGESITLPGIGTETLRCLEWPPAGEIGAEAIPIAFIVPPARSINYTRMPGYASTTIDGFEIRFYLGPGGAPGTEVMARRCEAWIAKVLELFAGFQKFGGVADATLQGLEITDVATYSAADGRPIAWGFHVRVGVLISETAPVAA
jgi:hypothetical protein